MGTTTLLVGGARSGKSALAVQLGRRHAADGGDVVFVATAEAGDDDMAGRIRRHRDDRPAWPTVEEPVELAAAIAGAPREAMLLVDCVTLWVANLMLSGRDAEEIAAATTEVVAVLADRPGASVVITNEVGMGVHPEHQLGRAYRDALGTVNQVLARHANRTLMMVAGRGLELRDPFEEPA